jgi:hypothetical protein
MMRMSLNWRVSLWIAGSLIGAAIVALPDSGDRLFSLSKTHGPSPVDLLGVTILAGSWLPVALILPSLWRTADRVPARLSAAIAAVGAAGLAFSIATDMGGVWLIFAAMLVAAQVIVIANGWTLARGNLSHD